MADLFIPQQISSEFWALLHKMGLPEQLTVATIRLAVDEPVKVTAEFYLTTEEGELQLLESGVASASADFVFVRADELERLESAARPLATGGDVAPGLALIAE